MNLIIKCLNKNKPAAVEAGKNDPEKEKPIVRKVQNDFVDRLTVLIKRLEIVDGDIVSLTS